MNTVSSSLTCYYKRIFPMVWFGGLTGMLSMMLFAQGAKAAPLPMLVIPVVMGGVGYLFFKMLLWDLMDQVNDCGDHLQVKRGGREDKIFFKDIQNVNYSRKSNPQRVELRLRKPSIFGDTVAFAPPFRFVPLSRHDVVENLISRIDQAREK